MSDTNPESSNFINSLNTDVTESILSLLPIPSLVRFSTVSKLWRSIITSLPPSPSSPWLFLFGIHNTSSLHNQSFAFDPLSNSWLRLPFPSLPSLHLLGSHRFLFSTSPRFSFSPILKPSWRLTSPPLFPRINPLLGVLSSTTSSNLILILVGGVGSIGGLVNIDDRSPVQIYDSSLDSWQLCPPLPEAFRSNAALSSALNKRRFYVFDINSCFISSFSLDTYTWNDVQTLRPPGLLFAFLNSCNDTLVLGGMCRSDRGFSFNLWRVEEGSMEFSEIAIMPQALLFGLLIDNEDEEDGGNRFRSLKCVGAGDLVYVFNEDGHTKYPACVCEIGAGKEGKCRWRSVPCLPSPVNKFHKLVSFCSSVSVSDVFRSDEAQVGG